MVETGDKDRRKEKRHNLAHCLIFGKPSCTSVPPLQHPNWFNYTEVRSTSFVHTTTSLAITQKCLNSFLTTPQCCYKYTASPTWDGPTVLHEPHHAVSMVTTYSRRNSVCVVKSVRVWEGVFVGISSHRWTKFVDKVYRNRRTKVFMVVAPKQDLIKGTE